MYLDTSGDSLHKRGYRLESAHAPLNEVLAAGIIMQVNGMGVCSFGPHVRFWHFFGRAALIAHNMHSNIYRGDFGLFLKGYDHDLFEKIKSGLLGRAKEYEGKFFGRDLDTYALDAAANNIQRSMFDDVIRLKRARFSNLKHLVRKVYCL